MSGKKLLAWAIPAAVFAGAGFLALLDNPKWEEAVRHTLGSYLDYSSSTAG